MVIDRPGLYDLDSETYHADPTDTPSLSAGMINDLLDAPAKCFERSKRLNPNWEEDEKQDKFSVGTVSHVIFLEPHMFDAAVKVCPFDDWRTAKAKEMRDAARADGRTPILEKNMLKVLQARAAFEAHAFTRQAFADGAFEKSLFWRHPQYGFWCRARPDFIAKSHGHMNDYKATANANPNAFGRHAFNMGYHRRAAWYLEGAEIIFGTRPAHYWFCSQETSPPYLTAVTELDWAALEAGKEENDYAAAVFSECLRSGEWYGYREPTHRHADRAFKVSLPTYAYMQIDARLQAVIRGAPSVKVPVIV